MCSRFQWEMPELIFLATVPEQDLTYLQLRLPVLCVCVSIHSGLAFMMGSKDGERVAQIPVEKLERAGVLMREMLLVGLSESGGISGRRWNSGLWGYGVTQRALNLSATVAESSQGCLNSHRSNSTRYSSHIGQGPNSSLWICLGR